jgi:hypothetical protein
MRNGIKMNNTLFMDFFAVETSDDIEKKITIKNREKLLGYTLHCNRYNVRKIDIVDRERVER